MAEIAEGIENRQKANSDPCVWGKDAAINDFWKPSCLAWWEYCEGQPSDHGMKFCPFCGRRLEVKETTAHER